MLKTINILKTLFFCLITAFLCANTVVFAKQSSELKLQNEDIHLEEVRVNELPREARGVLKLIKDGGPFLYSRDGVVFNNREGRLPKQKRGYYREYTVPTPGAKNRGARRIVASKRSEYFYTDDHYQSFRKIKE